ncbi:MAG: hypothetical protein ACM3X4_00580 [Ignavibacteriales bacterium]
MLNLFSMHGDYFRNDENRFTSNIMFVLSESRTEILRAFLTRIGVSFRERDLHEADLVFQVHTPEGIPDAEIRVGGRIHILLEAKIGHSHLSVEQLGRYAEYLARSPAAIRRLVCVTQINDRSTFNDARSALEPDVLAPQTLVYLQWYEVLDLIKDALGLTPKTASDSKVRLGRRVGYIERLCTLFLREVEDSMYDKKIVAEIPSVDLVDITVTTQTPWFMMVAKRHCVWFPSGETEYGLAPSKYVAYYETAHGANENHKSIAYVARNVVFWNRITLDDAKRIPELARLFDDPTVTSEIGCGDLT